MYYNEKKKSIENDGRHGKWVNTNTNLAVIIEEKRRGEKNRQMDEWASERERKRDKWPYKTSNIDLQTV